MRDLTPDQEIVLACWADRCIAGIDHQLAKAGRLDMKSAVVRGVIEELSVSYADTPLYSIPIGAIVQRQLDAALWTP